MTLRLIATLLLAVTVCNDLHAQTVDTDTAACDLELRTDPQLERYVATVTDYADYGWIDLSDNRISLNGADWTDIGSKMQRLDRRPLRIVLIGDSHIQADGATSIVRDNLHNRYGTAGRGLIVPLRIAGTNEPRDYTITSSCDSWHTSRLVPRRGPVEPTFTGIAAAPLDSVWDITVGCSARPFSHIKLYYTGAAPQVGTVIDTTTGCHLSAIVENDPWGYIDLILPDTVAECTITLSSSPGSTSLAGLELLAGNSGIEFSCIGNNGAAYISYQGIGLGQGLRALEPDIVILSMGINDAWGNMTDADFVDSVNRLVNEITTHNPSTKILLTTPAETQRRTGRRYRRGRTATYAPNPKVYRFRNLLLDYARRHSLATYDFYSVAGGDGSSHKWISANLFARDRIHLTWAGYSLMGNLLSDALTTQLEQSKLASQTLSDLNPNQ